MPCFYSFSLSLQQSKYNLAPIWFNHRGLIPAGKMDSFVQTERKRRIGGPEEMRRKSPEDRGMWGAAWWMETDEKRRKIEKKTRCAQWMRSLIGLRLVAPLQYFRLVPDRNQIILKFFNKEKGKYVNFQRAECERLKGRDFWNKRTLWTSDAPAGALVRLFTFCWHFSCLSC